jgi:hypothetical protein
VKNKDRAGEPYMPSNGTEGMYFMAEFCDQCKFECPYTDEGPKCEIITMSLIGEQPTEWIYDPLGNPTCTKHIGWNWWDDDGNRTPPPPEEPISPNQLSFGFPNILDTFGAGVNEEEKEITYV